MTSPARSLFFRLLVCSLLATAGAGAALAAPPSCNGKAHCVENASFVALLSDFRTSVSGTWRIATATMNFHNKLNRPLTLAYVGGSGVVTDDQGNRYVIGADGVRGMGAVAGKTADTKFTLEPGESSDARFEFGWKVLKVTIGTKFDMDLTVQEIDATNPAALKMGKERVMRFADAGNKSGAAATTPAPGAPAAPVPTVTNPCEGLLRCSGSGPFIAQLVSLVPQGTSTDRHHSLKLTVAFRNVSNQPVIIGYKSGSSGATDNLGNTYYRGRAGTHDTSATGIGLVAGGSADASFVLQPGESRNATFGLTRYEARGKQLGTAWTYDVTITQLEVLPSSQVRSVRDHSLHFADLSANMPAVGAPNAVTLDEAVKNIKDLFKKKK